jgi:hypothetical protein
MRRIGMVTTRCLCAVAPSRTRGLSSWLTRWAIASFALSAACGGAATPGESGAEDAAGDVQAATTEGGGPTGAALERAEGAADALADAQPDVQGDAQPGALADAQPDASADAPSAACTGDDDCPAGALCSSGACVPGCSAAHACIAGAGCCSGQCRDLTADPLNCGSCGNACSDQEVPAPACAGGACTGACAPGFADCNHDKLTDGCEANLASDTHNCGACGTTCSTENLTVACDKGVCDGPCAAGWADCNANKATNGCETNTQTSAGACGWCGMSCSSNHVPAPACSGGACDGACATGWADCNGDRQTDGCEVDTRVDLANCGSCGAACSHTCAAGACVCRLGLPGAPALPVGPQPQASAVADFDGDGRPDLVVTNFQAQPKGGYLVSVFLNQGGAFFARTDYAVDPGPIAVVAGDLNGDGAPDLAVAAYNGQAVDVLLNDGRGAFGASTKYVIANQPADLALVGPAGTPNIVVVDEYSAVLRTMGNLGGGTFSANPMAGGMATGKSPSAVAVGDVDGDGVADMAVANTGESSVSVFRSRAGRLDLTTGVGPTSVAIADLNGDGKLDLVASDGGNYAVRVFLNPGNGAFGAGVPYSTAGRVRHIAVADFDEDGHPDIATSNDVEGYPLNVLLNKGDATFGTATGHASSDDPPYGTSVVAADFRGRGHADIALVQQTANTVYLYVNEGKGQFAIPPVVGTGTGPVAIVTGDLNGDGAPDLVTANAQDDSISVLVNTGAQTFAAHADYSVGNNTETSDVALGDLNGDGKLDVVASNASPGSISVFLNKGTGAMATAVSYPSGATIGSDTHGVAIGDLNGDHAPDVVAVNNGENDGTLFFNDGHGAFPTKATLTTGHEPNDVVIADFDGDGTLDIAVTDGSDANVAVLLNQGKGTFAAPATYPTGKDPSAIAAGDLNADGRPDLVVVDSADSTVSVLINTGAGFAPRTLYGIPSLPGPVALADFDGDGRLDVVAASQNDASGVVSVFLNTGGGALGPRHDYSTPFGTSAVAAQDFDGDGKMDVAATINPNGHGTSAYMMYGGCL